MTINFGENIRKLRLAHKLTQEKLADFLGVSFQAVSKWERGDTVPDIFMLPAIASFFGVSVDYLLNFNQFEKEKEIEAYEKRYYQLWRKNERDELLCMMKEAVNRYPAEYRLLVRYLNVMVWCALDSRRATEGALIHTCGLLAGVSAEKEKIPKMTAEPLAKTIENYIFRCKKIVLDI